MGKTKSMIYTELMTKLYDNLKTAHEEDEVSYFEIIGIMDKLKDHFTANAIINITDIMIKRQIRLSKED